MSEELCDGVRMLIERMQTNPEDFEYGGKLHGYRNTMEEVLRYPPSEQPMWFLNETEKKALIKAYTDMHKQVFTTGVVQAILAPEPEYDFNMDRPYGAKPSKLITPQKITTEALAILERELDKEYAKEYAKNRNT
jgi:hypothetical protein